MRTGTSYLHPHAIAQCRSKPFVLAPKPKLRRVPRTGAITQRFEQAGLEVVGSGELSSKAAAAKSQLPGAKKASDSFVPSKWRLGMDPDPPTSTSTHNPLAGFGASRLNLQPGLLPRRGQKPSHAVRQQLPLRPEGRDDSGMIGRKARECEQSRGGNGLFTGRPYAFRQWGVDPLNWSRRSEKWADSGPGGRAAMCLRDCRRSKLPNRRSAISSLGSNCIRR